LPGRGHHGERRPGALRGAPRARVRRGAARRLPHHRRGARPAGHAGRPARHRGRAADHAAVPRPEPRVPPRHRPGDAERAPGAAGRADARRDDAPGRDRLRDRGAPPGPGGAPERRRAARRRRHGQPRADDARAGAQAGAGAVGRRRRPPPLPPRADVRSTRTLTGPHRRRPVMRPTATCRFLAGLAILTLALVGLGPGSATAQKTKLKMLFWTFQPQTVQGFVDEFMKRNPGIEVELDGAPSSEYNAKASVMLRSGSPFDVMYIRDATLPQWVENGWVHPIDGCPGVAAAKKDMLPLARQSLSYKGKLYCLTYYTGFFPIIVNKKMMWDAGFTEPPRTFQGWLEQARAVKAKHIAEYPMVWPIKPYGWGAMYVWATMAAAKGGKVFDDKLEVTPV